jgi:hypothetical protein
MRGHAARVEGLISPILAASVFLGLKKWLWDGQSFPRMLAPMIALGPFAVGIWVGSRRVVNRRRRNKLCLTCGYDLTGNVSGVCPECGTAVEEPR